MPDSRAASVLQVPLRGQKQEIHHQHSRKKGSGPLLQLLEPSPRAQVAKRLSKRRRKVRRSLASQLQPASATPPSQPRLEAPRFCTLALDNLEVSSKLLLAA